MNYSPNTVYEAKLIFLQAAEYIRRHGWREKGMGENGRPRCSMGALASAGSNKVWDKKVAELMYAQLYKKLNGLTLTEFNHVHQNGEEVASLFEKTAESLDELRLQIA